MITKLNNSEQSIYDSNHNFIGTMPILSSRDILGKINELVDAVNSLQTANTLIAKRRNDWKPILDKAKKMQKAQKSAKKSA